MDNRRLSGVRDSSEPRRANASAELKIFATFAFFAAKEVGADGCAIWYNMTMEQRDDIFDFGMMNAEDSLIDEVNPDWRDFADGGDELFWRCGCETDFVHPESLSVCPIGGRERDI